MLMWMRIAALLIGATAGAMPTPGRAHIGPEPNTREAPRAKLSTEQLLRRADTQRRNGELAAAWADLSEASERTPQHPALPHQRALWHLAAGEPTQALAAIASVVANDPANSRAHATRARALDVLGRPALAAAAWERAIVTTAKPPPEYFLARSQALQRADDTDPRKAVTALDEGIARLGPAPSLVNAALRIEGELGAYDAALARIDAEIARSAEPVWWLERRGELLCAANRTAEARATLALARRRLDAIPAQRRSAKAWLALEVRLDTALAHPVGCTVSALP